MRLFVTFLAGALFGLGLLVSGMTDTVKVQGFLDLFGAWDPTLIFVMGGAMIPMLITWQIVARRDAALSGEPLPAPARSEIDRSLILGAVMFGMGWGLVGLCPGPALAAISFGGTEGLIFAAAMLAGMFGHKVWAARA